MVWEIIKDYLPVLKELLIDMLPKIENSEVYINEALKTQYYEELYYLKNQSDICDTLETLNRN